MAEDKEKPDAGEDEKSADAETRVAGAGDFDDDTSRGENDMEAISEPDAGFEKDTVESIDDNAGKEAVVSANKPGLMQSLLYLALFVLVAIAGYGAYLVDRLIKDTDAMSAEVTRKTEAVADAIPMLRSDIQHINKRVEAQSERIDTMDPMAALQSMRQDIARLNSILAAGHDPFYTAGFDIGGHGPVVQGSYAMTGALMPFNANGYMPPPPPYPNHLLASPNMPAADEAGR